MSADFKKVAVYQVDLARRQKNFLKCWVQEITSTPNLGTSRIARFGLKYEENKEVNR